MLVLTCRPNLKTLFCSAALITTAVATTNDSEAAERYIDRPMTLHRLVFAGDVGLGIGTAHVRRGLFNNDNGVTGLGMNLEGALGVTENFELGLRTGIRFGDDGRIVRADSYGRTLWTETYGVGADVVANPELRGRYTFYSGSIAEVGADARMFLPVEDGTSFGLMLGVPLAFHVADFLRIDTGAYLPIIFTDRTQSALTVPGYFWFQINEKLWLGPMASLRFGITPNNAAETHLLLGFGLGYQVANAVDIKTMVLFPAVDDTFVRLFGAGIGVQFRIND